MGSWYVLFHHRPVKVSLTLRVSEFVRLLHSVAAANHSLDDIKLARFLFLHEYLLPIIALCYFCSAYGAVCVVFIVSLLFRILAMIQSRKNRWLHQDVFFFVIDGVVLLLSMINLL